MHRGCVATAYQIGRLLSVLALDTAGPDASFARPFDSLAARIPPSDGQIVVTARTKCVVCGGDLLEATGQHGRFFSASPRLFTRDGAMACYCGSAAASARRATTTRTQNARLCASVHEGKF